MENDEIEILQATTSNLPDEKLHELMHNFLSTENPNGDTEESMQFIKETLNTLSFPAGQILIAKVRGEIASMIGFWILENAILPDDGRCIATVGKASTLPKFAEKGMMRRLIDEALQRINKDYPQMPIYIMTKNPRLKQHMKKRKNFVETEVDDTNLSISRVLNSGKSKKDMDNDVRDGYVRFIFDPLFGLESLPPPSGSSTS